MENPELYQGAAGYYSNAQFTPERRQSDTKSTAGDHFIVEDLLDFPNDDGVVLDGKYGSVTGTSADSSAVTAIDSCNSSFSGGEPHCFGDADCRSLADTQFSNNLCVPYDDLAELEWLSNIVEESFSSEDLQKLQLISGMSGRAEGSSETREFNTDATHNNSSIFHPEVSVPGKARSKRSRAAPCNWASRLLALSPTASTPASSDGGGGEVGQISSSSVGKKTVKPKKKQGGGGENLLSHGPESPGDGRKCLHCATGKTPQWRTGPMGPKTLCNACGVRYKSGRLVPEYRPAASPTFVLTKHSNSHRKVMELRRQKESFRGHQLHPGQFLHHQERMDFEGLDGDDYLIHQHLGPDYRQLI